MKNLRGGAGRLEKNALPVAIGDSSTIKIGAKYLDRKKTNDQNKQDYKVGNEGVQVAVELGLLSRRTGTSTTACSISVSASIMTGRPLRQGDAIANLKIDKDGTLADTLSRATIAFASASSPAMRWRRSNSAA